MKTRRFICFLLAGVGAPFALAEDAAKPAPPPNPVLKAPAAPAVDAAAQDKPGTVVNKPERPREVSSEVSATIMAGMPKYNPPPKKPEPKPGEEAPDLREVDKPRNGIIRLPEHVVREKRPAVLQEQTVSTKAGRANIATHRYITDADRALNRWNIFGMRSINGADSTTERALAMYAEDERLKNMSDLNDTAHDAAKSSSSESVYLKRATEETYMRSADPIWTARK